MSEYLDNYKTDNNGIRWVKLELANALLENTEETLFRSWPKIPRDNPFIVTISEKINGTNACIIIKDGAIVGVQSRKQLITPEKDNFGFASWVKKHETDLMGLGDGYHYGEWAGPGIQKNRHQLPEKQFFLFDTFRWNSNNPTLPTCCHVVPVLFEGKMDATTIDDILFRMKTDAPPGTTPEGIIVYYHKTRRYTKHTLENPDGKWNG